MSRPKSNTVDYYPHLIGDSRTIRTLRKKFGNDGYAVYFLTLDALAMSEGHYLDLSDSSDLEDHATDCMVTEKFLLDVLNFLANRGRIDADLWLKRVIWSEKFTESLEAVYKNRKRELPKKPSFYGRNDSTRGVSTIETPVSTVESTQSKVKESKLNESKAKESKLCVIEEKKFSDNFEAFWDVYGRKINRARAEREYIEAIKETAPEIITMQAAAYRKFCKATDRIMKDPVNWIRDMGYLDEWDLPKNKKTVHDEAAEIIQKSKEEGWM